MKTLIKVTDLTLLILELEVRILKVLKQCQRFILKSFWPSFCKNIFKRIFPFRNSETLWFGDFCWDSWLIFYHQCDKMSIDKDSFGVLDFLQLTQQLTFGFDGLNHKKESIL